MKKNQKGTLGSSKINIFKWEVQENECNSSLRGVFAVNKKIVWASGSDRTFLRTIDEGENWVCGKIEAKENLDFRDIQAFNADTALVMSAGRPAKIYKTTNGGKDWDETYHNDTEGVFFNSMAFWDEQNGIAVGDPVDGSFLIIITSDGGESWCTIPARNIPKPYPGEAQFAASGTCIVVCDTNLAWFATGGSISRVFKSVDKGKTWTVTTTQFTNNSSTTGIFSITFNNKNCGIIVGGDYQNPNDISENILITNNGGLTWVRPKKSIPSGFRSCVCFITHNEAPIIIAMGKTGSDYSIDNGNSWNFLDSTGYYSINFMKDGPVGWAVGNNGRIAKFICE